MKIKYGLDVKTPTNIPGDDPWKPVMKNAYKRELYDLEGIIGLIDAMKRGNASLETRVVEVEDDDPVYSV